MNEWCRGESRSGVISTGASIAGNQVNGAVAKFQPCRPSYPNWLSFIPTLPPPTHFHFLNSNLDFYNNFLSSLPNLDLAPLNFDLFTTVRVSSLKCKSDHLIVLLKHSCGSLLNSELSPSFLSWLLHKHTQQCLD